ncbi:NUDIX hydrolase [Sanguibacter hominis]|uniref:NUDIX hydrolase n=1 Tax=Sanguibacter hominis TaxID=1312739 RepID=UPI003307796A
MTSEPDVTVAAVDNDGGHDDGATSLGADWTVGPDGVRSRSAARVLVIDDEGRALLVRGHDLDQPERSWWFTVGGGIDEGETPREAAARELWEETGMRVAPGDLVGPVIERDALFHFLRESCRQQEVFFLVRVPGRGVDPSDAGWTDTERELLDELRWITTAELRAQEVEVFPESLADLVDELAAGWDGVVRSLGIQSEG